jgi:hypothetical protein
MVEVFSLLEKCPEMLIANALRSLSALFKDLKLGKMRQGERLPKQGANAPVEFASSQRVDANPGLREDFVRRVLQMDWAFISDESSLWDFHGELSNAELQERINDVYGVDVSDIESGNVADILKRITDVQQR